VNAILEPLTRRERDAVRRDLRNCGFEGVLGKLRKGSREYYPGLHGELQRWCWIGYVDGWRVQDVARGSTAETTEETTEENEDFEVGGG
jgi:hypothetical protein